MGGWCCACKNVPYKLINFEVFLVTVPWLCALFPAAGSIRNNPLALRVSQPPRGFSWNTRRRFRVTSQIFLPRLETRERRICSMMVEYDGSCLSWMHYLETLRREKLGGYIFDSERNSIVYILHFFINNFIKKEKGIVWWINVTIFISYSVHKYSCSKVSKNFMYV